MKKNKNFNNYLLLAISGFFIANCQGQLPTNSNTKSSTSKSKASPSPKPTSISDIKTVEFSNRKDALAFLRCLMGAGELSDGKPSLLSRDVDNMEKAKPAIDDKVAQETYTKYVNDILRLYGTAFKSCNSLKYKEI